MQDASLYALNYSQELSACLSVVVKTIQTRVNPGLW